MKATWNVTYEVVTEASAMEGDCEERGFDLENVSFRDAVEHFGRSGTTCEADTFPVSLACPPRWFTRYGEMDYKTGDTRSLSLHIPKHITPSSRLRIARLVGCYGI